MEREVTREGRRNTEGSRDEGLRRPFSLKLNDELNKSSVQTPELEAMGSFFIFIKGPVLNVF